MKSHHTCLACKRTLHVKKFGLSAHGTVRSRCARCLAEVRRREDKRRQAERAAMTKKTVRGVAEKIAPAAPPPSSEIERVLRLEAEPSTAAQAKEVEMEIARRAEEVRWTRRDSR